MNFCYVIDKIVPIDKAAVPINDLGFLRGYAFFDFFRTVKTTPLFLEEHLERLMNSARPLNMYEHIKNVDFEKIIHELISKIGVNEDIGFKIIVTGGTSVDGFSPTKSNLYILPSKIKLPSTEDYHKGISLKMIDYSREIPYVKTTNYLEAIKKIFNQNVNSFNDVLYYHKDYITETSRANFYIVKQGKIITPELNILSGVTRNKIIQIASKMNKLEIRPIHKDEVFEAEECFVTSTTKRVLPITKIDDQVIGTGGIGKMTAQLLEDFLTLERAYVETKKG